jgi:hypothetical protein
MNNNLMKIMSLLFNPEQQILDLDRGGSSAKHIEKLIAELIPLFNKYNIQSIFVLILVVRSYCCAYSGS